MTETTDTPEPSPSVPLRFIAAWTKYNAGDVAVFHHDLARKLVDDAKVARVFRPPQTAATGRAKSTTKSRKS